MDANAREYWLSPHSRFLSRSYVTTTRRQPFSTWSGVGRNPQQAPLPEGIRYPRNLLPPEMAIRAQGHQSASSSSGRHDQHGTGVSEKPLPKGKGFVTSAS